MLANHCWTLRRDVPQAKYSRRSTTVTFSVMHILPVIYCKYRFSSQVTKNLACIKKKKERERERHLNAVHKMLLG